MVFSLRWLRSSHGSDASGTAREGARGAAAGAIAVAAVLSLGAAGRSLSDLSHPPATATTTITMGELVTTSDEWTERLSDPGAWRGGRYSSGRNYRRASRSELEEEARERREEAEEEARERREEQMEEMRDRVRNYGTYRTVCVRLCDGSFYPISFSTTPDNFARDEAQCRSSCRTAARLYVYPNPGGEPEQMVSVAGQPYTALDTAFLFRTKYDAACTCKPHPWEQEALAKHRAYAEAQRSRTTAKFARTTPPLPAADSSVGAVTDGGRRPRPDGAMLLGADQPPSQRTRTQRNADARREAEPPRNPRSGSYGRRSDWQSRAFGGF